MTVWTYYAVATSACLARLPKGAVDDCDSRDTQGATYDLDASFIKHVDLIVFVHSMRVSRGMP